MATVTHKVAMPDGSVPDRAQISVQLVATVEDGATAEGHLPGDHSIGGISRPTMDPATGKPMRSSQNQSGIDQIHHAGIRIPLQVLDAIGSGLFPNIAMAGFRELQVGLLCLIQLGYVRVWADPLGKGLAHGFHRCGIPVLGRLAKGRVICAQSGKGGIRE